MDIQAILFDKDGTLFDFYATWGIWARTLLLDEAGGDAELAARMGDAIGYDIRTGTFAPDSMVIFDTPPDIAAALLPFFDGETVQSLTDRLNTAAAQVPMVEATPLIPLLLELQARGLKLGVATNDGEAPARAHLEASGISGMFDFIVGSDSGYGGKPEAGMMQAFADHIGVAGKCIAMVGDSVHDLVAGRVAGMVPVAVLTGVAGQDELAPHADVVLPDIGHLPAWLG